MERGIRRQEIFQDEFDYRVFLKILRKESEQKVHDTCILPDDKSFSSACRNADNRNRKVYEKPCRKICNVL